MNFERSVQTNKTSESNVFLSSGILQRKCGCGNHIQSGEQCTACSKNKLNKPMQTKLQLGETNDRYEQEADRVTQQVMRMSKPKNGDSNEYLPSKPLIQRLVSSTHSNATEVPSIVHDVLRSAGQPLNKVTRNFMEPRFGHDFSGVRIHTDAKAAESAHAVNAKAYTVGNNIVFGAGEYTSDTSTGRKLFAHELAHTIQQNGMVHKKIQRTLGDGHDLLAERFQGRLDLEAAYDDEILIKSGRQGPDVIILQLSLMDTGHPLPNFGADGRFGPETQSAVEDFQRANGLKVDGIVGPRTMEVLDGLFTVGPVIAPVCNNPGVARTLRLQPVFLRNNVADPNPTGGNYFTLLSKSNEIWSKLGVTFTTSSPVFINNSVRKTQGSSIAELLAIGGLRTGAGIEVFFVDNNLTPFGGGATRIGLGASFIILSDFGTSGTLLAHELGHVLSNSTGHPPANGEAGTIMEPSGSHSTPNPERNTIGNLAFIVFPAGTDPICLTPDP
ncbi:MAG: DUF4157 domain-containing protein [Gammaproteobacteria bacterium]|nr:DUF4157 domain-containing protein [Gammaproteobacteria bacterium]